MGQQAKLYIFKTLWAASAGFWPSVLHFKGINTKEKRTKTLNGDLIHRWGKRDKNKINNSNKKITTTTRQTIKTHEKYLNSIIIQQRNTKASETKQHKIETKQIKERNSLTLFKTSNIFFI